MTGSSGRAGKTNTLCLAFPAPIENQTRVRHGPGLILINPINNALAAAPKGAELIIGTYEETNRKLHIDFKV